MSLTGVVPVQKHISKGIISLMVMAIILAGLSLSVYATDAKTLVTGKVYTFLEDSDYVFTESISSVETNEENTYGQLSVSGNIANVGVKNGVPAYKLTDGNLSIHYNYGDTLLTADEDSWHLVDDKSKDVNEMKLDERIMKGAIIIQTSKDGQVWVDDTVITNAFSDIPVRTESIYNTTPVQLNNGCYYRVTIVYECSIRTEQNKILVFTADKHENKKFAETYEFYACLENGDVNTTDMNQTYSLGSKVRVDEFESYFGEEVLETNDIHYGWDLGNFYVSGYTDEVVSGDNVVFLKNVGDKITLWFHLNSDIDCLNGQEELSVTADKKGSDQYFETPQMNFGRGTLIIRHTDYNNVKSKPTIYTNYLEANVLAGAETKVQLFEEGDYEVALDYEVTSDGIIDKVGHYRIFFTFSVRNGNCMVYPFDTTTGSELTNSSMTENGFRLDLAKSRYLKVNVKREVLKDSADGLVEDTRFNGPAKDGAEYTTEGIYTITVHNEYTNQFTVKKIYVGSNKVLRAYMATGLPISEINELVNQGATIADDGTIKLATVVLTEEPKQTEMPATTTPVNTSADNTNFESIYIAVGGIVVVAVVLLVIVAKKKNSKAPQPVIEEVPVAHEGDETKGGN